MKASGLLDEEEVNLEFSFKPYLYIVVSYFLSSLVAIC